MYRVGRRTACVSGPLDSHVQVRREERSRGSGSRDARRASRSGKRGDRDAAIRLLASPPVPQSLAHGSGLVPLVTWQRRPGEFLFVWWSSKNSANAVRRSEDPPSGTVQFTSVFRPLCDQGFVRDLWLFLLSLQGSLAGVLLNLCSFVVPSTRQSCLVQIRLFIQVMNTSPPYLRVGPVAIHIRSRETDRQPASPPSDYPFAEPTLVVQGSVFLSPDNGAFVEELNGVPVSKFLIYKRRISHENGDQVPSNTVNASPSAPPPPAPPSVASVPSPSISPSIVNAGYVSML